MGELSEEAQKQIAQLLKPGAFAPLVRAQNVRARNASNAYRDAARNLLNKALRALVAGEMERSESLLDKALALPFDEHEEALPAALAASSLLYEELTDRLEETPKGDLRWINAVVSAFAELPPAPAGQLAHFLSTILREYQLVPREAGLLGRLVEMHGPGHDLWDAHRLPPAETREAIWGTLGAYQAFVDSWETSGEGRDAGR